MPDELMIDAARLSDRELVRAWQSTDGTGALAEALIAEIERRELDL